MYIYILPCSICFMCVFILMYFCFFSNLYLYNTVLSVLFCVNKDIIIIIYKLLDNSIELWRAKLLAR